MTPKNQEKVCENCGKTKWEHYGLKRKLYCENLDWYDENSKQFTPKKDNHKPQWECKECGSNKKSSHKDLCHKCYMFKWNHTEKGDKLREKYNSSEKGLESKRLRQDRYSKKYPEKLKAKEIALRNIIIPKGQKCEICKINSAIERHHRDYSKPLEVVFVCKKCHTEEHTKLRRFEKKENNNGK